MILFSDLHLDNDSAEVCLGTILPEICKAALASDRSVVFLGDWWHLRYRVDVRLQVAVRDELLRWSDLGVGIQILVGNHDQVNIQGRNALEVFDDLPNVRVYSEPTIEGDFVWLPYRTDLLVYHVHRAAFPGRTVFVHQAFSGATMNEGHYCANGLDPKDYLGSRVFAGHYHKRQQVFQKDARIWYVGSPRQVTAAESGQPKGFCILEGEVIQFVDTLWGPRFHRFDLSSGEEIDLSGVAKGDDVRVTVPDEASCVLVGTRLDQMGLRHTVTPRVQSAQVRCAIDAGSGLRGYADAWAREHGKDPDRLMQAFDLLAG